MGQGELGKKEDEREEDVGREEGKGDRGRVGVRRRSGGEEGIERGTNREREG